MRQAILNTIQEDQVYAIIPARSGSKGLVDKNILDLSGFPLMAYSIVAAKLTNSIDRIIVSTDSSKYAEIAKRYGAEVPVLRPSEISQDQSTDLQFMKHIIDWLYDNEHVVPQYFAHLRVTCPLRRPAQIDDAIASIKKHPEATSLLSACIPKGIDTPYKWLTKDGEFFKSLFFDNNDESNMPRQSYPLAYMRSIYVDILSTSNIVKNDLLFGNRILAYETDESIDIDELYDFNKAKKLIESGSNEIYEYLCETYVCNNSL